MSEQFQVCDLNGTETFKSTKTFKSLPDTNENILNIIKRSDNHNYIPSKVVDNVTDTYETFLTNGNLDTKISESIFISFLVF